MNEIINITTATINNETVNAVNARDLWMYLGSKRQFANWIHQRLAGFVEGRDFTVNKNVRGKNGRFQPADYMISLDVAKHLAMLERNAQGYRIRQYFIEVEKQFRNSDSVAGSLIAQLERRLMIHAETIARMRSEIRFLRAFAPAGEPGDISNETGNPKFRFRRGYYTSGNGRPLTALIERYDQPGLFDEIELQHLAGSFNTTAAAAGRN